MRRHLSTLLLIPILLTLVAVPLLSQPGRPALAPLDKAAEKWVAQTLKSMTLDEKIGQLLFPSFNAVFTSSDTDIFEKKIRLARELHVGGFHTFGGSELMPEVLLDANYGGASASRKGDP